MRCCWWRISATLRFSPWKRGFAIFSLELYMLHLKLWTWSLVDLYILYSEGFWCPFIGCFCPGNSFPEMSADMGILCPLFLSGWVEIQCGGLRSMNFVYAKALEIHRTLALTDWLFLSGLENYCKVDTSGMDGGWLRNPSTCCSTRCQWSPEACTSWPFGARVFWSSSGRLWWCISHCISVFHKEYHRSTGLSFLYQCYFFPILPPFRSQEVISWSTKKT